MSKTSSDKGSVTDAVVPALPAVEQRYLVAGHEKFVGEQGGNDAPPTYQDAAGAPVESHSPLGYNVGFWTALFLNVCMLIGTGIFSTPSNILASTGSVGLSLIYWVIGLIISLAGISVYLELASYFPSRSGSEVVYLEQAFPRPRYFFPIAFAVQCVILSFNSSNAIVLATYIFRITDRTGHPWELKGVAIAGLTFICAIVIASTKFSLKLINTLGVVKLLTLLFITITGFVVLGGHTHVKDPHANFRNAFAGTKSDGYTLSNALVSIIFSYGGYNNSFNVVNEVKDPIRTIKRTANSAVIIVAILYILVNIAYFAAIPKAEIVTSTQVTATLFFTKLFGERAAKGLTILPILSAGGNILAVIVGHARMIREVGRQGVLPFPKFFVSTRPFGTPLGPVVIIWLISVLMIVIPPAGDAFNFIIALQNYPDSAFLTLMTAGLFVIRHQRKKLNVPPSQYRSWTFVVLFFLASKVFLIIMPWVPPKAGVNASPFHFAYYASSLTGLGIISLSFIYYYVWAKLLPKWGGYSIRQAVIAEEDGTVSHKLIKVPNTEVEEWDRKHDPAGRSINSEWEEQDVSRRV